MIFIKVNNCNQVNYTHYMPFHEKHGLGKTQEQLEQEGILVDSIPEPKQIEGKAPILYCNPETKELWYEYEDIPPTPEDLQQEKIQALEQSMAELSATIAILQTHKE
ncbi:hypothetical protein [Clostridium cochlearium]|uniref:hypothetical protein n=1 Tax=Clostridium cochlearium TaxID=1494 RepID=UPI001A9A4A10|nr:hypothetical protein [Clostridium cochlearium]